MAAPDRDRPLPDVAAIAAEDLPGLIAEARAGARHRVKTILEDAIVEAMLAQARAQLEPEPAATPPEPPPPRADPAVTHSTAVYVYGVVEGEAELPAGLEGIDPHHSPTLLRHDGLAAVTSRVPVAEFGEEHLRTRLTDMEWLERTARRHEEVVEAIGRRMTLIPMRLCSIYRTPEGVSALLAREADALTAALRHIHGKAEWGVKVFTQAGVARGDAEDAATAGESTGTGRATAPAAGGPGTRTCAPAWPRPSTRARSPTGSTPRLPASSGTAPVADPRSPTWSTAAASTMSSRASPTWPSPACVQRAVASVQLRRGDVGMSARINSDPEKLEKGLAHLVLTIIELLRQLMERQALYRIEGGTLTEEEIERLGRTRMALADRMEECKRAFGLEDEEMNLDLGPLGDLL